MMAGSANLDDWCFYPSYMYGLGNCATNGTYNNYANLLLGEVPLIGNQIKLVRKGYSGVSVNWFDSSHRFISNKGGSDGAVLTAPSNAAFLSAWFWDKPPLSAVESGVLGIQYFGRPITLDLNKNRLTAQDYPWVMGNYGSSGGLVLFPNKVTRCRCPIVSNTMVVDNSNGTYNINPVLFAEGSSSVLVKLAATTKGNIKTYDLSTYPTAARYELILFDQPSFLKAHDANFIITFD